MVERMDQEGIWLIVKQKTRSVKLKRVFFDNRWVDSDLFAQNGYVPQNASCRMTD